MFGRGPVGSGIVGCGRIGWLTLVLPLFGRNALRTAVKELPTLKLP